ncbi:MAG: hypothetical protein ACLRFH_03220 [Opitutales bacterium]
MGDLSLQKLSANRKNAQLSTGPKTALGKGKSALNAVKHGIFAKELIKNVSAEELQNFEVLKLGLVESLKPKDAMQSVLCEKISVDVWRLRKVLAFEQGASQLEMLNLDTSDSPVDLSRREVLVGHLESYKSELENLNQLKNLINNGTLDNLSELSGEIYELLFEVIQRVKQRFPEIYEKVEIDYLHECENLRDFCEQNDIEIETFKQDLLDRIENKLRSGSNMPNYYENNLQEFDHKHSIYESVAQLPSAENTDKVIRYETHLQRSIEKNLRLLRSLQGYGQMSFGFVW